MNPLPSVNSIKENSKSDLVENDLNNGKTRKTYNPKNNLTKKEKTAMEELAEGSDIITTNADKVRAIVILNTCLHQ